MVPCSRVLDIVSGGRAILLLLDCTLTHAAHMSATMLGHQVLPEPARNEFLLASIASVSLIVGGIGIMNIMLVSVTERTKEIGLRQAVGAKTGDILSQFLVEAVTLSIAGGTIGIILGVGASLLISYFASWSTVVSIGSVLLAFLFSALVGVFFGYYPARKAAFLDPIEALRYE